MELIRKYDDDEVLIFGGKFADEFTNRFFSAMRHKIGEAVRNAVADNVETVMRNHIGYAEVPLPAALREAMTIYALDAAIIELRNQLTPTQTFGLTD